MTVRSEASVAKQSDEAIYSTMPEAKNFMQGCPDLESAIGPFDSYFRWPGRADFTNFQAKMDKEGDNSSNETLAPSVVGSAGAAGSTDSRNSQLGSTPSGQTDVRSSALSLE